MFLKSAIWYAVRAYTDESIRHSAFGKTVVGMENGKTSRRHRHRHRYRHFENNSNINKLSAALFVFGLVASVA